MKVHNNPHKPPVVKADCKDQVVTPHEVKEKKQPKPLSYDCEPAKKHELLS